MSKAMRLDPRTRLGPYEVLEGIGLGGIGRAAPAIPRLGREVALKVLPVEPLGRLVFSAAVLGAGMVAAAVCSLGFAWGLGEVAGYRHTLERKAPAWFIACYTVLVVGTAYAVTLWPDLSGSISAFR